MDPVPAPASTPITPTLRQSTSASTSASHPPAGTPHLVEASPFNLRNVESLPTLYDSFMRTGGIVEKERDGPAWRRDWHENDKRHFQRLNKVFKEIMAMDGQSNENVERVERMRLAKNRTVLWMGKQKGSALEALEAYNSR